MGRKVYTNAFSGGEISPLMLGHIEDESYRTGFARGRNMVVLPTGPATKRPQFEFVRACKPTASVARLFPFVYGDGDAYAMEWGTNHVRFHAEGGTLLYATPIPVASVDLVADTFTTVSAHGLAVNNEVRITHLAYVGSNIPGNLSTATTYKVESIPTSTTFSLKTVGDVHVDLNTHSTIAETSFWKQSELPREYVAPLAVAGTDTVNNTFSAIGATFVVGDSVFFTGAVPVASPALSIGVAYYVGDGGGSPNYTLHLTKAQALAATNVIDITGGSVGATVNYAYLQGDVVWGGSVVLDTGNPSSSREFIAISDLPATAPTSTPPVDVDWHQMPADGVFELYTTLGADALADLNYDQSLDVWTLCKPQSAAYTLGRETSTFPSGTSSTVDVTKWVFRSVDPSPGPPNPLLTLGEREFGEHYSFTIAAGAGILDASGVTVTSLLPGDVVYLEGSLGDANACAGVPNSPGFFVVTQVTTNQFRLRNVLGGNEVASGSGSTQSGVVRVVGSSGNLSEAYVVTALREGDESLASNVLTVVNSLDVAGSRNTLEWSAVTEAQRYRLYKKIDGAYGLILETDLLTATDDNIGPDLSIQPPTFDDSLESEYPRAVANFQQRQWFGGTSAHPRRVWGSKTGTVSTMSYHTPSLIDTDRIVIDVAARERTLVRHIVPASQLWLMTSSGEIRLTGLNTDILSPVLGIDARALSQVGCTIVRPIVASSNILFVGASSGHIYELPSQLQQVVNPPDLSIRSSHLFDVLTLTQSAQQEAPVPIEWYTRSDGTLLGFTYMPEQNIRAWHVHTAGGTDAEIQSVCVIPDSDGQRLYAVISRTINGGTVLHVERMGRIAQPATLTACRYLDSCVTYTGAATTTIPVAHLVGETVYAVADGVLRGPFVVSAGGTITLGTAASTVHVGLLYAASLRSLPPAVMIDGYGKGMQVNAAEVSLRVDGSCGFKVGVYSDDGFARTPWDANGISNLALTSKDIPVPVEGSFGRNAQIEVSQSSPFPLTIVSMTLDVTTGGP